MKPKYIDSTNHNDIILELLAISKQGAHFTNGTYAFSADLIIPTTLAGFKQVLQSQPHLSLVIAVNSDKSMAALNKPNAEPQAVRAAKVAEPLAKAFPNNQILIIYYDKKTPTELYEALNKKHLTKTLHKWGYGTSANSPKIEGAQYFETVFGFPLPNDKKPVCYDITPKPDTPQKINVIDLRNDLISENGVLFDLPEELEKYVDSSSRSSLAMRC